jgi:hypothetical protein
VARDPYQILGIDVGASLSEAREAYHRLVELFHPDRLQGLRGDVQAEAEKRLREATSAIKSIQGRFGRPLVSPGHEAAKHQQWVGEPVPPVVATQPDRGPNPLAPSDEAERRAARVYEVELREVEGGALRVRWHGAHAAAVLAALRHAHRVDGPIRQIDWGGYEVVLDGAAARRLLCSVDAPRGWHEEPAELLGASDHQLPVRQGGPHHTVVRLGAVLDQLRDDGHYTVVAEVY